MNWKKILTYALIVLGFLALSYAFVPQVLGGKIVNQSDISGWQGMAHESTAWNAQHPDDPALWSDSMFGGMPTVSFSNPTKGDWTQKLYDLLLTGRRPATYIFIALLGAFLLLLAFGVHPLIAIGGAVAIAFCSYNFQIIQVGHNTKMQAIAFMPWALAAVVFAYRSKTWPKALLGAAMFALAVSFQVKANHPQISYYLAIMIVICAIAEFAADVAAKKKVGKFFVVSAALVVFGLIGIGSNATKLIPTWDYTQYSMRGGTTKKTDGQSAGRKGLDLDYATAWSYGWEELPNTLIPDFNGGVSKPMDNDTKTAKVMKRYNASPAQVGIYDYWGPQPFTAGPMYMGAITIFLFLLGLFCCKGKDRWWLLAASIFAILLAVGSHFMVFTKLAMKVLPLYNKFRTVSMALVVLQITLPVLGFLVLDKMVRGQVDARDFRRASLWALGITGGFCLLMILFPAIGGSYLSAQEAAANLPGDITSAMIADRVRMMRTDAAWSLFFIAASWALLWWSSSANAERNRRLAGVLGVSALVLVNMFAVGKRYLNADHFVTPKNFSGQFAQRPVDKMILADEDPSYRVLDLTVNVFNDSHPSYWHKNIGGYSPAKLQLYQEYIESHLNSEIGQVYQAVKSAGTVAEAEAALPYLEGLSKMNCRYIILDGGAPPVRYPYAKGAAWFEGDSAAVISLTSYSPNELRYHYNSATPAKAVFSEVYYPEGWTLMVEDTAEVLPIGLSDNVLRSAVLPAGEHDLVMRFAPDSYRRGQRLSLLCSILTLVLAAGAVVLMIVNAKKED